MTPVESVGTPLSIGDEVLDGRLVIEGLLGSGSMGVVYRAQDRRLGRAVAVKTLAHFEADRLYQLKRGFRTLAGISHRNLVQLYELGAVGDLWFLIMELIDGLELGLWLQQGPAQSRLLQMFGSLAEGLHVLHAAGLMHRDVKPANIMVTGADQAVVLDFGLTAPIKGSATLTAGSLDYMAPEQLWNDSPGAPADWYSFGVVLFEALTGALPFTGPNRLNAMRAGLGAQSNALLADVAPDVAELVRGLLAPVPARRPGYDAIARVLRTPAAQPTSVTPRPDVAFIGRVDTLQRLRDALQAVHTQGPQVVHVHGPSGIGKTALMRHFMDVATGSGDVLVLEGHCHPQESVPYKALDALIDNLAKHLLGLDHRTVLALAPRNASALLHVFPVLGRVAGVREWPSKATELSPADLRRRGCDGLREVLAKLSDRQTVVLWIDDIQWSDHDSAAMLQGLLEPPDAPSLLLLLTAREDQDVASLLSALPASLVRTDLPIDRLTKAESLTLAEQLSGGRHDLPLDIVAEQAGGSPFLVGELVRYLRETADDGHAQASLTLGNVLRSRFQQISPSARRLLEFVAIAGQPLEFDLALEVSGTGPAGRLLAYSLCETLLLRITTHDKQAFLETYHDVLREFAIRELDADVRRARHRTLAQAIAASRTPNARTLVRHYLEAGDRTDAAHHALIAAQEAERDLAFDQATEMLDVAIAHTESAALPELLERRARMLSYAGRWTEAALGYEKAAHEISSPGEARTALRIQAAEHFFFGGELKRGLAALEAVLSEIGVAVPRTPTGRALRGLWLRARFIVRGAGLAPRDESAIDPAARMRLDALWRTTRGVIMLDPQLADVLAGMHVLESLSAGDACRALRALGLEAAIESNIGGRWFQRRSHHLLETAERLALTHGGAYEFGWLTQCRAVCAFCEGRWRECVDLSVVADQQLRQAGIGASWDLTALYGFLLSALAILGRLPELTRRASELVSDAERRRDKYALRAYQTGDAVLIWIAADQVERALRLAEETLVDYMPDRFTSQHRHHLVATVQAHLYAGQPEAAWAQVERAWPYLQKSGFLFMDFFGTQLRYLKACTAVMMAKATAGAQRRRFVRVARHETRRIRRSALPMGTPMAQAIEAGIAGVEDRRDARLTALRAAADGFHRADMALHREAIRWHLGSLSSHDADARQAAGDWMQRQGILQPALMARAIVPDP